MLTTRICYKLNILYILKYKRFVIVFAFFSMS